MKHTQKWEINKAYPFHTLNSVYFVYIVTCICNGKACVVFLFDFGLFYTIIKIPARAVS